MAPDRQGRFQLIGGPGLFTIMGPHDHDMTWDYFINNRQKGQKIGSHRSRGPGHLTSVANGKEGPTYIATSNDRFAKTRMQHPPHYCP